MKSPTQEAAERLTVLLTGACGEGHAAMDDLRLLIAGSVSPEVAKERDALPAADVVRMLEDMCKFADQSDGKLSTTLVREYIRDLRTALASTAAKADAGEQAAQLVEQMTLRQRTMRAAGDAKPVAPCEIADAIRRMGEDAGRGEPALEDGDSLQWKFEQFIDFATGGKLSKSSWALETLKAAVTEHLNAVANDLAEDHPPQTCEDCGDKVPKRACYCRQGCVHAIGRGES